MNSVVNRRALRASALALAVGVVVLAGCKRDAGDAATAPPAAGATAAQPANIETPAATAPVELRDVI
ncbi:MAG: hypothetical protein RSA25_18650, partial [Stenotrophomonas sp.]